MALVLGHIEDRLLLRHHAREQADQERGNEEQHQHRRRERDPGADTDHETASQIGP